MRAAREAHKIHTIVTMLRQRKAKDDVLPLHSAKGAQKNGGSRRLKKRSDLSGTGLRVLYAWIALMLGIAGFVCICLVWGRRTKPTGEIMHNNRHYHSHTAKKILSRGQQSNEWTQTKKTTKAAMDEPQHHLSTEAMDLDSDNEQRGGGRRRKIIPLEFRCNDGTTGVLNDNYCDCPDGSDEPETSACSFLTVQQATFHCADGSGTIFASRVQDGVKDCHDGSDES